MLHYIEHLLILVSTVTGCVCISAFVSLVGILVGIAGSALGMEIWAITSYLKSVSQWLRKKRKNVKSNLTIKN